MCAMYDAAYRPGMITRDDDINVHQRSGFIESPGNYTSNPYGIGDEEGSHQFGGGDENDDVSDIEGSEELEGYSSISRPSIGLLPNIGWGVLGLTTSVLQTGTRLFYQQRQCVQMGEGPTLLRLLCFLGGFVMLTSSILSIVNIFALLTSPSTYVLQLYQGFFGIITMIVEAKDWECFDQFKPWMTEWFRFLTVPAGKGAFYLFVGSLGVSLWVRNFLSFTVGLYMAFMGIICIAVHAGTSWKPQLDNEEFADSFIEQQGRHPYDRVNESLNASFRDAEGGAHYDDDEMGIMQREASTTSTSNYSNGLGGARHASGKKVDGNNNNASRGNTQKRVTRNENRETKNEPERSRCYKSSDNDDNDPKQEPTSTECLYPSIDEFSGSEAFVRLEPLECRKFPTVEKRFKSFASTPLQDRAKNENDSNIETTAQCHCPSLDWATVPSEGVFRNLFINQILTPSLKRCSGQCCNNYSENYKEERGSGSLELHQRLWPHSHLSCLSIPPHTEPRHHDKKQQQSINQVKPQHLHQQYLYPVIYAVRGNFCTIVVPFIEHPEISYCHQIIDELGMMIERLLVTGLPNQYFRSISTNTQQRYQQRRLNPADQLLALKESLSLLIPLGSMIVLDPIRMRHLLWEVIMVTGTKNAPMDNIKNKSNDTTLSSDHIETQSLESLQSSSGKIPIIWDFNKHKVFRSLWSLQQDIHCFKAQLTGSGIEELGQPACTEIRASKWTSPRTSSRLSCPFVLPSVAIGASPSTTLYDRLPSPQLYTIINSDKSTQLSLESVKSSHSNSRGKRSSSNNSGSQQPPLHATSQTPDSICHSQVDISSGTGSPRHRSNHLESLRLIPFSRKRLPYATPSYTTTSLSEYLKVDFPLLTSDSQIASLVVRYPGARIVCLHPKFRIGFKSSEWLFGTSFATISSKTPSNSQTVHGATAVVPHSTPNIWDFRHSTATQPSAASSSSHHHPSLPLTKVSHKSTSNPISLQINQPPLFRVTVVETLSIIDITPWLSQRERRKNRHAFIFDNTMNQDTSRNATAGGHFFRATGSLRCLGASSSPTSGKLHLLFSFNSPQLQQWAYTDWIISPLASWKTNLNNTLTPHPNVESSQNTIKSNVLMVDCQEKKGSILKEQSTYTKLTDNVQSNIPTYTAELSVTAASNAFTILAYQLQLSENIEVIHPVKAIFRMIPLPASSNKIYSTYRLLLQLQILTTCLPQFLFFRIRIPILQPKPSIISNRPTRVVRRPHSLTSTVGNIKIISKARAILWEIDPSDLEAHSKSVESASSSSHRCTVSLSGDMAIQNLPQLSTCSNAKKQFSLFSSLDSQKENEPGNIDHFDSFLYPQRLHNLSSFLSSDEVLTISSDDFCYFSFAELSYALQNYSVTGLSPPTLYLIHDNKNDDGTTIAKVRIPSSASSSICQSSKHLVANSASDGN